MAISSQKEKVWQWLENGEQSETSYVKSGFDYSIAGPSLRTIASQFANEIGLNSVTTIPTDVLTVDFPEESTQTRFNGNAVRLPFDYNPVIEDPLVVGKAAKNADGSIQYDTTKLTFALEQSVLDTMAATDISIKDGKPVYANDLSDIRTTDTDTSALDQLVDIVTSREEQVVKLKAVGSIDTAVGAKFIELESRLFHDGNLVDAANTVSVDAGATLINPLITTESSVVDNERTVSVRLKNEHGELITQAGHQVTFSTTGLGTFTDETVDTDEYGVATTTFNNTKAQSVNITATVDHDNDDGVGTVELVIVEGSPLVIETLPGPIDYIDGTDVGPNDGSGTADGIDVETVFLEIRDSYGNNLASPEYDGLVVTWDVNLSGTLSSPTSVISNGQTSIGVSDTVAETVNLTATIDGNLVADTVNIVFS